VDADASTVAALYETMMRSLEQRLTNGEIPLFVMAQKNITNKEAFSRIAKMRHSKMKIVSDDNRDRKWILMLDLNQSSGITLTLRYTIKPPALTSLLKKLIDGATEAMEEAIDDPEADKAFAVSQLNLALEHAESRFNRTFMKGEASASLEIGDSGRLLLEVSALRNVEYKLPSDERGREKRRIQVWNTNRELMGTRNSVRSLGTSLASKHGFSLVDVQEVRERTGGNSVFGYRIFFNLPNMLRDANGLIRMITELLWGIGKNSSAERNRTEQETAEQFVNEYGAARDKAGARSMTIAVMGRNLINLINDVLNDGSLRRLPPKLRTELEKVVSLVQQGHIAKEADLQNLADRVKKVKALYSRGGGTEVSASVVAQSPLFKSISEIISKEIKGIAVPASLGLTRAGVANIPTTSTFADTIAHSVCADVERYGMLGREHSAIIPVSDVVLESSLIASVQCGEIAVVLWGSSEGIQIRSDISGAMQRQLADIVCSL